MGMGVLPYVYVGIDSLETKVIDDCKPPNGCWKMNQVLCKSK